MKNLTEMLKQFNDGDKFSDTELLSFFRQLEEVHLALYGKGDMFVAQEQYVFDRMIKVEDMLKARKIHCL